jgi:hypothetical protein
MLTIFFNQKFIIMAKYKQGVLGSFSGKVGAVVGSRWKDVSYIKSLPSGNNSNTEGQQKQRSRFKATVSFASALMVSIIKPIWNLAASSKLTDYNLFVKTNMKAFSDEGELIPDQLKVSVGNLPLPTNIQIVDDTENSAAIKMTWEDESGNGIGAQNDVLRLLVYKEGKTFVLNTNVQRSAETASVDLPVTPSEVNLYAFF